MIRFKFTIAGIPCVIEETTAWDRGWHVLDRRGRPAPWLEAKITAGDEAIIARRLQDEIDARR